jgi:hypothetical protein
VTTWAYAHFQGVSRGANRSAAVLAASAAAGSVLLALPPGAAGGARALLLSLVALAGVVSVLAYCGAAIRQADVLTQLASGGGAAELPSLDAHPGVRDFVRYALPRAGRAAAATARTAGPLAAYLWCLYLWGYALGLNWPAREPALVVDALTLISALLTTGPLSVALGARVRAP